MASLLSCGMEKSERISEHVDDARRMGIKVLPPDVNCSDVEFSVVGNDLTFGLGAIKGLGESVVASDRRGARTRTARSRVSSTWPNASIPRSWERVLSNS